jgi:CubicO group peptidase (beta-lactamase class C family)
VAQVRTHDPAYQVFLKHWLDSQMPPSYRDGLVFVNDSQGFRSLAAMVTDFAAWGQHFAPAPVGFQFGYARDRKWWRNLANPPRDVGMAILGQVPNARDLYWVDFTAYEIWPAE